MSGAPTSSSGPPLDRDPRVWRFRLVYAVVLVVVLVIVFLLTNRPLLLPDVETVNLYCFSGAEDVMRHGIIPVFRARYEEETGHRVDFITTFAGSGIVTRRIVREFPADLAILSSPIDALYASSHGVRSRPGELPHGGVVATSPLVIVVRPGNPLGIRGWADLAVGDVEIVHPDPATSGDGVWSVLVQYESVAREMGSAAAMAHLVELRQRVVSWPESAAAARDLFESGTGDALITYHHDAIATPRRSTAIGEIVHPDPSILTEHVALGVIGRDLSVQQQEIVTAFLEFLWSDEARAIFQDYGLEAPGPNAVEVVEEALGTELLTLEDLGGAAVARRDVLEGIWFREIRPEGT